MSLASRVQRLEHVDRHGAKELWIILGGSQPTEAEREAVRAAIRAEGSPGGIFVWEGGLRETLEALRRGGSV